MSASKPAGQGLLNDQDEGEDKQKPPPKFPLASLHRLTGHAVHFDDFDGFPKHGLCRFLDIDAIQSTLGWVGVRCKKAVRLSVVRPRQGEVVEACVFGSPRIKLPNGLFGRCKVSV